MSSQDAAINIALRMTDQVSAPYQRAMAMVERSTGAAEKRMKAFDLISKALLTSFVALLAVMGGVDLIKTADTWNNLHGRLKLVTESTAQLADVEERLFGIAQNSRQGYEQTADLYARIARSTQDMNLGQEKTLTITDTINKSLIVSGTASESAAAAIVQLGQGFASGVLRGEELNSVLEQAPRLAEAIADGMGVSVGQLRELGKEGKLTAEAVAQALVSQSSAVTAEFEKMPKTISQAMTVLNNKVGQMISGYDQATSFTAKLAEGIISLADNLGAVSSVISPLIALVSDLADNFGTMVHALEPVGVFIAVWFGFNTALSAVTLAAAAVETGIGLVASAIAGATLATGTLTAAVAANPILAGIIVASGVVAYLWQYSEAADAATDKTEDWNKQIEMIGENSDNITEFQANLVDLQNEANKKLREDSWLYQLQKWTGGIWLDEKVTALLKRGQELGLTDSATGRAAMKSTQRVDPFPGKTFDMAYADQGAAALNYDIGLGYVKNKVRSLAPHPLTKEQEDAAKKAQKEAERLAEQWTTTRRELEQEVNLSGLTGLERKLQEITDKATEYHLKFDAAGGKASIAAWEESTKAAARQADEIERVTKQLDYQAQANEDILTLEKELELAAMSKDQREIKGITDTYALLLEKSHLLTLMGKQTEEAEAAFSRAISTNRQKDLDDHNAKNRESWDRAILAGLPEQEQALARVHVEFDEYRMAIIDGASAMGKPMQDVYDALDNLGRAEAEAIQKVKDKSSELTEFQIQAYRNMQDAGASFFEGLRTNSDDWLDNFVQMTLKMVDQWASAQMMMSLLGEDFGKGGKVGGVAGAAVGAVSGAWNDPSSMLGGLKMAMSNWMPFADGGWIHEPVVGVGLRSGKPYSFAENEPELVMNQSQVRSASANTGRSGSTTGSASLPPIQQIFHIDARGADAGVEQRIRSAVEEGAQRGYRLVIDEFRRGLGPIAART